MLQSATAESSDGFSASRSSRIAWARNVRSAIARHAASARKHRLRTFSRSEEHTSELQSLMRISYAVFCLKKKKLHTEKHHNEKQNKLIENTTHSTTYQTL